MNNQKDNVLRMLLRNPSDKASKTQLESKETLEVRLIQREKKKRKEKTSNIVFLGKSWCQKGILKQGLFGI